MERDADDIRKRILFLIVVLMVKYTLQTNALNMFMESTAAVTEK